jgi:hypothetical protein
VGLAREDLLAVLPEPLDRLAQGVIGIGLVGPDAEVIA